MPHSAPNILIRDEAGRALPACMTAENIFVPKPYLPALIPIPPKIVPQSVKTLVLSLVPKTARLITPPAAPLNVRADRTAATERVSPLLRAVITQLLRLTAQDNANIPQVLHAAETGQCTINPAEAVNALQVKPVKTELVVFNVFISILPPIVQTCVKMLVLNHA